MTHAFTPTVDRAKSDRLPGKTFPSCPRRGGTEGDRVVGALVISLVNALLPEKSH